MIKRIDKTISLHGATAHVFRHTLGTLVYSETKDVKIVQVILGHSDFKTTADRYVHPEKSREQSAMERVNNVLLHHDHNKADSAAG